MYKWDRLHLSVFKNFPNEIDAFDDSPLKFFYPEQTDLKNAWFTTNQTTRGTDRWGQQNLDAIISVLYDNQVNKNDFRHVLFALRQKRIEIAKATGT